jgi:hypothetical protein
VRELRPGLWHWEAPHPDWEGSVRRGLAVSSYASDDGGRLLLFDPIAPPRLMTREQVAERSRPLLALPVEVVLATHGAPTDRAALERALS